MGDKISDSCTRTDAPVCNPKKLLTELTPKTLAQFIHKIIIKADGKLEVHNALLKRLLFILLLH